LVVPIVSSHKIKKNNTWNAGIGYRSNDVNDDWNINNYIKEKQVTQIETCKILKQINSLLNENNFIFIKDSYLLKHIINITRGINLLEIENEKSIFIEIIEILSNIKLFSNFEDIINSEFINAIVKNLHPINDEIMMLFQTNEELQNNELYQGLHNIFQIYAELITDKIDINNEKSIISNQELYYNTMKLLQFEMYELSSLHKFYDKTNIIPNPESMKRIISEISSFKTCLPLNYESTIWVRIAKKNMNLFTFLISGPKDTPYENGLFLFNAYLPNNYPQVEPKVVIVTTGNGTVRFNPNLYNCGKICLSLLGTWSGLQSEKWNPKTSTFLQVLVSIQSLILIDQPYFNEPGFEHEINTPAGQNKNKLYNNNIQYENIKWAMIDQLTNPPQGYAEVVKNHFKLKKNDIITVVDKWLLESNENNKSKMLTEITNLKQLLNNL